MELLPLLYKLVSILFDDAHRSFEVFRFNTVVLNQFNVWF